MILAPSVNRVSVVIGSLGLLVVLAIVAGRGGAGDGTNDSLGALLSLMVVLIPALGLAVAWLLSAAGWGWLLRRALFKSDRSLLTPASHLALQLAAGVAAQLFIVNVMARLEALAIMAGAGAWLILGVGLILLLEQLRQHARESTDTPPRLAPPWLIWTAVPSVAVLLIAACSAPGWLWQTEFGGYDALSYHLQLPREWHAAGAITAMPHNVYGHFPSYVEGAFLHLMTLVGDPYHAAYACQMLHAMFGVMTAVLLWVLVADVWTAHRHDGPTNGPTGGPPDGPHGGRPTEGCGFDALSANRQVSIIGGCVAGVTLIGTPWVIVVGSLAYNEMTVALMLVGCLIALTVFGLSAIRRGILVGLFCAGACGAKLTAVGFVVVPVALLMLWSMPRRDWVNGLMAAFLAGLIGLSPWLVGNTLTTGNPTFPFLTGVLGTGHWTQEQAEIWNEAHFAYGGFVERVAALYDQWLRFGIGANPDPSGVEPWRMQWSILPWLAIGAALLVLLLGRSRAAVGSLRAEPEHVLETDSPVPTARRFTLWMLLILAFQIVFWMMFTHLKSRFLLPTVVPSAAVIGLAVALLCDRPLRAASGRFMAATVGVILAAAMLAWTAVPVVLFAGEGRQRGAPAAAVGYTGVLSGRDLLGNEREQLARESLPHLYINYLLDPNDHVLLIGEAATFYYALDSITYTTVWDRGPLSREFADGASAEEALAELGKLGFTHVLVDELMLRRWDRSGWNDPNLRAEKVIAMLEAHADREHEWRGPEIARPLRRLYRLRQGEVTTETQRTQSRQ